MIHSGCAKCRCANKVVTTSTPVPTANPRMMEAHTYAPNISQCDSGGSMMNTRLPVIFDWMSDDELFANAFCSTLIITRPGTRKAV
ncbi:hypothetical protein FZN37_004365 [Enterobacter hormaechei]|nr:hypothetical protein FZN37_004365 [Enterobacter hormaechei]